MDSAGVFYCPSCATWRRALSTRASANSIGINRIPPVRRTDRLLEPSSATSVRPITSSSVITAGRTVPRRFKELYDALSGVKDAAIQQVNLSRLQLALRGLESEEPLIRVAGECFVSVRKGGRASYTFPTAISISVLIWVESLSSGT